MLLEVILKEFKMLRQKQYSMTKEDEVTLNEVFDIVVNEFGQDNDYLKNKFHITFNPFNMEYMREDGTTFSTDKMEYMMLQAYKDSLDHNGTLYKNLFEYNLTKVYETI